MRELDNNDRLIDRHELRRMVVYTPQHVLRLEKQGKFPKRIQIGENRVAWLLSDILAWIQSKADQRLVR